jgi:hypothetical protein
MKKGTVVTPPLNQNIMEILASQDALVVRTWNHTPITRRTVDGYVNATAMCKANGKEWSNYYKSERTSQYLQALQGSLPNGSDLVQVIGTGPNERRGTYVHPRLAVDLARWISPEFAVWMDGWFMDEVERQAATPASPQPPISGTNVLNLLKESVDFIRDLGCFDDRDKILFSDLARNNAMRVNSDFLLPPGDEEMTIGDAYMELFQGRLARNKASIVGKFVANSYRKQFDEEPPTRIQYVDGAPRKVKSYKKGWLLETLKLFKE